MTLTREERLEADLLRLIADNPGIERSLVIQKLEEKGWGKKEAEDCFTMDFALKYIDRF